MSAFKPSNTKCLPFTSKMFCATRILYYYLLYIYFSHFVTFEYIHKVPFCDFEKAKHNYYNYYTFYFNQKNYRMTKNAKN